MTEELIVKRVKLAGGRHFAVHLPNRDDVAVGIGNLRYTLNDKAGNRDAHSPPNQRPCMRAKPWKYSSKYTSRSEVWTSSAMNCRARGSFPYRAGQSRSLKIR